MSPRMKILIILSVLLVAAAGCDFLPAPDTSRESDIEGSIATSVAATLAAEESVEVIPDESEEESEGVEPDTSPKVESTGEAVLMPTNTPEPLILELITVKAAYVRDGNVYYWQEGLAPLMLTSSGDADSVRISDDGNVVAFTRGPDWYHQELWAINSDGSNLRQLVDQTTLDSYITTRTALTARIYSFEFKPGTHQVAFNTQLTFEGPGLILNDDLRIVDADSTVLATILSPGNAGNFFYSPDGTKIGLVTGTQVSVVNDDGTGRIDLLAFPMVITYSEYQYYPPLYWTGDGSAIRVVIPPEDPMLSPSDLTRVWHLPADGSPTTTLMSMVTVAFPLNSTTLSKNAERVAYLVLITPGDPPVRDLHVTNADGSGDVTYATGPINFYGWGTNGEYFIYSDADPNPKIGQYGAGSTPLASVTKLINASWANASDFLFQSKNGANFELWFGEVGGPSTLIDSTTGGLIGYDIAD